MTHDWTIAVKPARRPQIVHLWQNSASQERAAAYVALAGADDLVERRRDGAARSSGPR